MIIVNNSQLNSISKKMFLLKDHSDYYVSSRIKAVKSQVDSMIEYNYSIFKLTGEYPTTILPKELVKDILIITDNLYDGRKF